MAQFKGVLVPIITPLDDDDAVDLPALRDLIEWMLAAGVHGIIPIGSTGEAISLSQDEVRAVVATTIDQVRGRVPVIVGCSANATRDVIARIRQAQDQGADGILVTNPIYAHPDDDELLHHYAAISAALDRSLILYNNPHVTSIDASPELIVRICALPHIDHVKESSGDVTRVARLIALGGTHPRVLCGSDNLALESFSAGALGWVAACANVVPAECVRLYELTVEEPDLGAAQALYAKLYPLFDMAEQTGKFAQISKAGIALRGGRAGRPRAPLAPLAAALRERLQAILEAIAAA